MIQQQDIVTLRTFHATHFPGQPVPHLATSQNQAAGDTRLRNVDYLEDDDLGYYEDGVKRTLTDDQIKMFRHSEIQRLLNERRVAKEREEIRKNETDATTTAREPRKRRFYDQPADENTRVDTLIYDDQPDTRSIAHTSTTEKKFLWPVLGQKAT